MPGVTALFVPHTHINMQRECGLFLTLLYWSQLCYYKIIFFSLVKKWSQQNESTIVCYVWHSLLVVSVCQALI